MDYINKPCPCKEGDMCPHYHRKLVGRVWELSRLDNDLGRQYRTLWTMKPKLDQKAKNCNCNKQQDIKNALKKRDTNG